jgi:hypothetical protein
MTSCEHNHTIEIDGEKRPIRCFSCWYKSEYGLTPKEYTELSKTKKGRIQIRAIIEAHKGKQNKLD